jgi:hypothetical protein
LREGKEWIRKVNLLLENLKKRKRIRGKCILKVCILFPATNAIIQIYIREPIYYLVMWKIKERKA